MSDTTTILAYVGTVMGVSSTLLGIVNHRRIRSNCCGVKTEMSIDVEATTPPERQPTEKHLSLVDASPPCHTNVPKVQLYITEDSAVSK